MTVDIISPIQSKAASAATGSINEKSTSDLNNLFNAKLELASNNSQSSRGDFQLAKGGDTPLGDNGNDKVSKKSTVSVFDAQDQTAPTSILASRVSVNGQTDSGEANGSDTSAEVTQTESTGKSTARNVFDALTPDAIVIGATKSSFANPKGKNPVGYAVESVKGIAGGGGVFLLFNPITETNIIFGTKTLQALPSVPTPFGDIKSGLSVVGSVRGDNHEAGIGYSAVVPTPVGDVLLFINARAGNGGQFGEALKLIGDYAAGNSGESLEGKADGTYSVNLGAAYSVSDGAVTIAQGAFAGTGLTAAPAIYAGEAIKGFGDLWLGGAWRAEVTIEDGKITSLKIGDTDIAYEKIGEFLAEQKRKIDTENLPIQLPVATQASPSRFYVNEYPVRLTE